MPDGKRLTVTTRTPGFISRVQWSEARLLSIPVPESANLASFTLATFTAPAVIGAARLDLTDQTSPEAGSADPGVRPVVRDSHEITAKVLPSAGSSLAVRVGSCSQWHGYRARTLYLLQTGGVPITGLRLSGTRD
jgi:hypothetical protein